jgi:hypothetical protein
VAYEGLDLHILQRLNMDANDLDPRSRLEIRFAICQILVREKR